MAAQKKGACLVVGAGDDTGAAIARRFAQEGFAACLVRRPRHLEALEALAAEIRSAGGIAHAYGVDAREEDAVIRLFEEIERDVAPLDIVVFNIGANVSFPVTETTSRVYQKVWEMAGFAGFLTGREAAKHMVPRGRGTIIFTGATASVRGAATYSAFAGAKNALRALTQSMARELGPKNIHIAHVIVDGAIDTKFIREMIPNADELRKDDALLRPDAIAEAYVYLHNQHRSAWTHEMDLRPWREKW